MIGLDYSRWGYFDGDLDFDESPRLGWQIFYEEFIILMQYFSMLILNIRTGHHYYILDTRSYFAAMLADLISDWRLIKQLKM